MIVARFSNLQEANGYLRFRGSGRVECRPDERYPDRDWVVLDA